MTSTQILMASGVGATSLKILSVVFTMKIDFCRLLPEPPVNDIPPPAAFDDNPVDPLPNVETLDPNVDEVMEEDIFIIA